MDLRRIEASLQRELHETGRKLSSLFSPLREQHEVSTVAGSTRVLDADDLHEVELLSESLQVDKELVKDGEISIRKETITEVQVIRVPVTREELVVERRTSDGRCMEILHGQKQLRIPISKERVIVRKEPAVAEVVKIQRRKIGETKHISTTVKHEELRVSKEGDVQIDDRDRAA